MDTQLKQQVREFYDQIGWQELSNGFYQNASYEDLRLVSREYIHRCHLRVLRHLNQHGRFLLDAGSGPIQYPEYLEYSKGYAYRVCADISMVALQEARKCIGEHGLFVVCDVAHLPFKPDCFDGEVSLHTLHHLPPEDHIKAYLELQRTLAKDGKAVVVNGWDDSPISAFLNIWIFLVEGIYSTFRTKTQQVEISETKKASVSTQDGRGTYVHKENAAWLQKEVGRQMPIQIWCWRSVSVHFMRTFIHPRFAGRLMLRLIYRLEELFPHFLGKYGQYPLVELRKNV